MEETSQLNERSSSLLDGVVLRRKIVKIPTLMLDQPGDRTWTSLNSRALGSSTDHGIGQNGHGCRFLGTNQSKDYKTGQNQNRLPEEPAR